MSWSKWEFQVIVFKRFVQLGAISANVPLLGDVAMQAERIVSAKIELNRENIVEATENQQ